MLNVNKTIAKNIDPEAVLLPIHVVCVINKQIIYLG